ncbi:MAG: hypothetical protein ABR863_02915 [Roseiarcus sp.]|jgi:hypothetical protein
MTALMDAVRPWLDGEDGGRIAELMAQIDWLGRKLYQDYEPSAYESFDERFGKWVVNVAAQEDRRSLFDLLDHVFFVGRREFEALCRAAYNRHVIRWLIDLDNAPIADPGLDQTVATAVAGTWFCPITDSMRINAFLKVNHLEGQSHRPDWRSLACFADIEKVLDFMRRNQLNRIVLLEDFVGSGTQMQAAVRFASEVSAEIPILVSPLICCPKGVEMGEALSANYANVTFAPVLTINDKLCLKDQARAGEPPVFASIRELTSRVRERFDNRNRAEPFGFKGTGALVVMYSNCPNNSLAVLHNESKTWTALFPRIPRSTT